MKVYNKVTPDGTRDRLFDECAAREEITGYLTAMFRSRGYRQVNTPAIEFYDVFASAALCPAEDMYKMSDTQGRLMVLRSDCTIPIARLTTTRLTSMPMPLRLYYNENVYRVEHGMRGKPCEIFQTGVELIGSSSLRADLETVEMAASGLGEICGERGFRIELCHIGYFKSLIDHLDADSVKKEEIRQCIEQKNYALLRDLLEPFNSRAAQALNYLPRLFGGVEVFEKAYELFDQDAARDSLDYLKQIYCCLRELGLGEHVLIDLGMVNQAEYYTGIIFRGYFDGIGEPVLSGGRYDNLLSDFGEALGATGFAFQVDVIADALERESSHASDILVYSDDAHLAEAINYCKSLGDNGLIAENAVVDDFDAAKNYAKKTGIRELHVVDNEIEIIYLKGRGNAK